MTHKPKSNGIRRNCPLCDTDNNDQPSLKYSFEPWLLKKCHKCSFVYLENPPGYEVLKSEQAWEETFARETEKRRKNKTIKYIFSDTLKKIKKGIRGKPRAKELRLIIQHCNGGKILDVGCGSAKTLVNLPSNYQPFGIELSKQLAEQSHKICKAKGGWVINATALEGLERFESEFFDLVFMRAFLEHELDPREVLIQAIRVLKPASRLIIKVPNYGSFNRMISGSNWCGFRFPEHVNYFTPESLRQMVVESGFEIVNFGLLDHFFLNDNMWMVAKRKNDKH